MTLPLPRLNDSLPLSLGPRVTLRPEETPRPAAPVIKSQTNLPVPKCAHRMRVTSLHCRYCERPLIDIMRAEFLPTGATRVGHSLEDGSVAWYDVERGGADIDPRVQIEPRPAGWEPKGVVVSGSAPKGFKLAEGQSLSQSIHTTATGARLDAECRAALAQKRATHDDVFESVAARRYAQAFGLSEAELLNSPIKTNLPYVPNPAGKRAAMTVSNAVAQSLSVVSEGLDEYRVMGNAVTRAQYERWDSAVKEVKRLSAELRRVDSELRRLRSNKKPDVYVTSAINHCADHSLSLQDRLLKAQKTVDSGGIA